MKRIIFTIILVVMLVGVVGCRKDSASDVATSDVATESVNSKTKTHKVIKKANWKEFYSLNKLPEEPLVITSREMIIDNMNIPAGVIAAFDRGEKENTLSLYGANLRPCLRLNYNNENSVGYVQKIEGKYYATSFFRSPSGNLVALSCTTMLGRFYNRVEYDRETGDRVAKAILCMDKIDIGRRYTYVFETNEFSVIYIEDFEELVCIQNSREIGERIKISSKDLYGMIDAIGSEREFVYNEKVYSPIIHEENGNISFEFYKIADNLEERYDIKNETLEPVRISKYDKTIEFPYIKGDIIVEKVPDNQDQVV